MSSIGRRSWGWLLAGLAFGLGTPAIAADGAEETRAAGALAKVGVRVRKDNSGRVVSATIPVESKAADADLAHLAAFPELRSLAVWGNAIDGSVLVHLKGLPKLERLYLGGTLLTDDGPVKQGTRLTDASLAHLEGLTGLRELTLGADQFTDAALVNIADLTGLRRLSINGRITDEGLIHLEGLTQLEFLFIEGPKINGAGLAHLKGLSRLRSLGLGQARELGAGLATLKGLTQVKELTIYASLMTEPGLEAIAALKGLERLRLVETQVNDDRLDRLREALPKTEIDYEPVAVAQSALKR